MTDAERRFTSVRVEVRAGSDKMTIGGYAAKFNRMSQNLGGFVERIDPAFFNKSRGDGWPDVVARYNHDDNMLLGTTNARTLRLSTDNVGLLYDADLPSSRADVYELVQRGDVNKSSFAFVAVEDDWTVNDQGFPLRTLLGGRLMDVAPVNTPAYLDTSTGLRSLARKFDAPIEEVRKLAEGDELIRFFKRSDLKPAVQRRSASVALSAVLKLNPDERL
ncbi:HK97 family phage prohead protease [Mycolicibacterium mageritense]|uniref:Prohead serine protease domain-containing protein n=1 Tax=Mycolicibacterium mageritense TaxID=53462 RepID=A0AAI8XQT0_MYCME|nr:HK97 family phage prohead protease [Mycolicibacterium mageritense]BDY31406.1 hypothetical protein hbim_05358 [Mycolicibacterium mageritense]